MPQIIYLSIPTSEVANGSCGSAAVHPWVLLWVILFLENYNVSYSCGTWTNNGFINSFLFSLFFVAPAQAQIIHAGQACVVKEDNISERVYTIREGDILVLQCLVTGHPRPQVTYLSLLPCTVLLPFTCYFTRYQASRPLSVSTDVI